MPRSVGIVFELRQCHARPGESLRVAGSCAELGAWGKEDACGLELRTSVSVYPLWMMLSPVWVEVPDDKQEVWLEYKYVRDLGPWTQGGRRTVWEDGIKNRRVRVPCQPGVWVLSDAAWESSAVSELRLSLEGEVARRRNLLDPNPLPITSLQSLEGYPVVHRGAGPEVFSMTPSAGTPRPNGGHAYAIEADYAGLDCDRLRQCPSLCSLGESPSRGSLGVPQPADGGLVNYAGLDCDRLRQCPSLRSLEESPSLGSLGVPQPAARSPESAREPPACKPEVAEAPVQDSWAPIAAEDGVQVEFFGVDHRTPLRTDFVDTSKWDCPDAPLGHALLSDGGQLAHGLSPLRGPRDDYAPSTPSNPEVSGREPVNPEVAGSEEDEIAQLRRENEELRLLVRALTCSGERAAGDAPEGRLAGLRTLARPPTAAEEAAELMCALSRRLERDSLAGGGLAAPETPTPPD